MKCSICGTVIAPGSDRCPACGCRCRASYTSPRAPEGRSNHYDNAGSPKRPRRWWCCLPTMLILGSLLVVPAIAGVIRVIFGLADNDMLAVSVVRESIESAPYKESVTQPASKDCFVITGGAVLFVADAYDGGPVLQVPETVDGQTVTAIGAGCFRGCKDLTTIQLPDTITGIQQEAFAGCSNLRGLFVPEAVESIEKDAFSGCISLEAVYIPAAVDSIAPGCFDDCARLLYLFYGGLYQDWREVYNDYINPFTTAICLDGSFYHGIQD